MEQRSLMLFFLLKDHVDQAPGYFAGHEPHVYRLAALQLGCHPLHHRVIDSLP
jgi:hypothetical protein